MLRSVALEIALNLTILEQMKSKLKVFSAKFQNIGIATILSINNEVKQVNEIGYQNINQSSAIRKSTIFRIASMTKPITAVAMMILYEKGFWKLNDSIYKHIPSNNQKKGQKEPTMSMLMSHSAGFCSSRDKRFANLSNISNVTRYVEHIFNTPLCFEPGEIFRYSNINTNIQGYLVERFSNLTYAEFVRREILKPLNMQV